MSQGTLTTIAESCAAMPSTQFPAGPTEVRTLLVPDARFAAVRQALDDIGAGRPVVVVADEDGAHDGELIFAADLATPKLMAFMVRHCSGFIRVALPGDDCERLGIPAMPLDGGGRLDSACRVSVDASDGVTTGISAIDRARTARLMADPAARPDSFTRPGHVMPLRAQPDGVIDQAGHAEAAMDLCRLAGRAPVGVLCGIVGKGQIGDMARGRELADFAAAHGLTIVSIAALRSYRQRFDCRLERVVETELPTQHGRFAAVGYRAGVAEHLAFAFGDIAGAADLRGRTAVPVRVHVECLLGDGFGAALCDCSGLLAISMKAIAAAGQGVIVYIRGAQKQPTEVLQHLADKPPGSSRICRGELGDHEVGLAVGILADLGIASVSLPPREADTLRRDRREVIPSSIASDLESTDRSRIY